MADELFKYFKKNDIALMSFVLMINTLEVN